MKKLIAGILFTTLALSSCLYWQNQRWPLGDLEVEMHPGFALSNTEITLDKTIPVVLKTNQERSRAERLKVKASLEGVGVEVSGGELASEEAQAEFRFLVTPRRPGPVKLRMVVAVPGGTEKVEEFGFNVALPLSQGTGEASFLEMVEAPDASIYGSHITVWNAPGKSDLFMVTGHAASSVCREASAVLFSLAAQTDISSPPFMLGAGVGCLDLTGFQDRLRKERKSLAERYPEVGQEMMAVYKKEKVAYEKAKAAYGQGPIAAIFLRRSKGDETERQERCETDWLEGLDELIGLSESLLDRDTATQRPVWDALSKQLTTIREKHAARDTKFSPQELGALLDLTRGENENLVQRVLDLEKETEYEPVLKHLRTWEATRQKTFQRELRSLVERKKAFETAQHSLNDLNGRTGLVRYARNTVETRADLERVVQQVSRWAANPSAAPQVEMAALASGHSGCLLLPFFGRDGKEVFFTVPESLLAADSMGANWQDEIRKSAAGELGAAAGEIHGRITRQNQAGEDQSRRNSRMALAASQGDPAKLAAWLPLEDDYTVTLYDDKGRPAGTHQERKSNLDLMLDGWDYAAVNRSLERFYGRLSETSRRLGEDDVFSRISASCLLDSLLRGWKLAFADDEMERRFESWSSQIRQKIWQAMWPQGEDQGFDCRQLFSEGTVFQVRREGTNYRIRPVFTADIGQTLCVRSALGGTGYQSAWAKRERSYYSAPTTAGTGDPKSPEDFALQRWQTVRREADTILQRVKNAPAAERVQQLVDLADKFRRSAGPELRIALSAAPERTVAALTGALLEACPVWKETAVSEEDKKLVDALVEWEDIESNLRKHADNFLPRLQAETWPFADHYALFSDIIKEASDEEAREDYKNELLELASRLQASATKIDSPYMKRRGGPPGHNSAKSDALTRAIEKSATGDEGRIMAALRIVAMLLEAERSLDNWDDRPQIEFYLEQIQAELQPVGSESAARLKRLIEADKVDFSAARGLLEEISRAGRVLPESIISQSAALAARISRWESASAASQVLARGNSSSSRTRTAAAMGAVVEAMSDDDITGWLKDSLEPRKEGALKLRKEIESGDYDAVDRQRYRVEINEIAGELVHVAQARLLAMHRKAPSRRTVEMLVQFRWSGGWYREAIETLYTEVLGQVWPAKEEATAADDDSVRPDYRSLFALSKVTGLSNADCWGLHRALVQPQPDEAALRALMPILLVNLGQELEQELLKACIYSGGEFFGASIFGKRASDWVVKPKCRRSLKVHHLIITFQASKCTTFGCNTAPFTAPPVCLDRGACPTSSKCPNNTPSRP